MHRLSTRSPSVAGRLAATLVVLPVVLLVGSTVALADSPTFRGPDRDGVFSGEDILQKWPDGGPALLWSAAGLGEGYASVSVADGRLYTTGMADQRGSVHAFDAQTGAKIWSTAYGDETSGNGYPGTRTTPTYADGRLFVLSSTGQAVALDAKTGEILWRVDILERFSGENLYFGISESPLVDGDRVIFTPGGSKASLVALDVKTGEVEWTTKGLDASAAYCNPRILEHGDHRQIVTLLASKMIGVDPATGELLWQTPYPAQYNIHAVSPVVHEDLIIVSDGYKQGTNAYRLAADGRSVEKAWSHEALDVHHGGGVVLDGVYYGAASGDTWYALDAATGKELALIRRAGKGAIVAADGRLIGYVEKGDVLLVDPNPKSFAIVSDFEVTQGEGQHWAHPVVVDGTLFIRHGDALMAYSIGDGAA